MKKLALLGLFGLALLAGCGDCCSKKGCEPCCKEVTEQECCNKRCAGGHTKEVGWREADYK